MLALSAMLATVLDVAHLIGIATAQHLLHELVIIAGIVARMGEFEDLPMINKDLFEDAPVLAGVDHHHVVPSESSGMLRLLQVTRFYHISPASSTPHGSPSGMAHPPLWPWSYGEFRLSEK